MEEKEGLAIYRSSNACFTFYSLNVIAVLWCGPLNTGYVGQAVHVSPSWLLVMESHCCSDNRIRGVASIVLFISQVTTRVTIETQFVASVDFLVLLRVKLKDESVR